MLDAKTKLNAQIRIFNSTSIAMKKFHKSKKGDEPSLSYISEASISKEID